MSESLEERVKLLEHEIERLHAIQEIQNLMGRYQVLHTPKTFWRTPELFALKQPDVSVEIAMWGVYIGAEQIKRHYQKILASSPAGTMFEHHLTTPMIEVAEDGQTAKGVWISPGHETGPNPETGKHQGQWCWTKYGCDFIKEDGEWKIWHYHWYDTFMVPYEASWVDTPQPAMDFIEEHPNFTPDKPPSSRSTYFPDQVRRPIPDYPEPYETWDGKSVC
jgi:hypothetical protein